MKILDVEGKNVKISKRTISVIKNNKFCGMVTGVDNFYSIPFREQIDIYTKMSRIGIKKNEMNFWRMFLINGDWYYLFEKDDFFFEVDAEYRKRITENKEAAEKFGAKIIRVSHIFDTRDKDDVFRVSHIS